MGRKKKEKIEEEEAPKKEFHRFSFGIGSEAKRSAAAVFLFALAVVIFLGFIGKAGVVGEKLSSFSGLLVGWVKWLLPFFLVSGGIVLLFRGRTSFYVSKLLGLFIILLGVTGLFHWVNDLSAMKEIALQGRSGGLAGFLAAYPAVKFLGPAGGFVLLVALFLIGVIVAFELTFHKLIELFKTEEVEAEKTEEEIAPPIPVAGQLPLEAEKKEKMKVEENISKEEKNEPGGENISKIKFVEGADQYVDDYFLEEAKKFKTKKRAIEKNNCEPLEDDTWRLPPAKLLKKGTGGAKGGNTEQREEIIENTFKQFGINVTRAGHQVGPAVTQYRFRPEAGVRVSQIIGLHGDLSLALAKHPIRIEAPIPGQSLIGIEVPNDEPAIVCLRDFVENEEFINRKSNLTLALGEDVSGKQIFTDLGKMPHLMIAGATGTGKSVSINSIVTTLLYQNSPKDLKFIMVDPKRVELSMYAGIPHLLTPVITENDKVVSALKWVTSEMEKRYRLLQDMGSQNLTSYHEKVAKGETRKHTHLETGKVVEEKLERLPFIVVVIDELAELMMSHGKEVEATIVRIAQLARAVGIHLIVSTQRPEVKIITGLIKANINARVAFKVNNQIDSRTILDGSGAEKLLGNGDMLYVSSTSPKPKRIQGVFISEGEVKEVVKFIKSQKVEATLDEEIVKTDLEKKEVSELSLEKSLEIGLENGMNSDDDSLFEEVKEEVLKTSKASASYLQRRFKVGYARAARLLDMLEEKGVVGPANGAKAREVYGAKGSDGPQYDEPLEDQIERDKWQM